METKASYAIVGSFVLLLAAGLFAFFMFIAKVQFDTVAQPYRIFFTGSVTGLQEGSVVRYRGVSVGAVRQIRISPDDAGRIEVMVELDGVSRLPQDVVATIEPQGITGLAYIQLTGGAPGVALMDVQPGQVPILRSQPSQLSEVVDAAPELLNQMILVASRTSAFLTPENAKNVEAILANLNTMTANANQTVASLTLAVDQVRSLGATLQDTSAQASVMMKENREAFRDFANIGLYDASLLIAEFRELIGNMSRMTAQIQRDPSGFLLAGPRAGDDVAGHNPSGAAHPTQEKGNKQ